MRIAYTIHTLMDSNKQGVPRKFTESNLTLYIKNNVQYKTF